MARLGGSGWVLLRNHNQNLPWSWHGNPAGRVVCLSLREGIADLSRPISSSSAQRFGRICAAQATFDLANNLNFHAFIGLSGYFSLAARIQPSIRTIF
jgi:hypothetical protein